MERSSGDEQFSSEFKLNKLTSRVSELESRLVAELRRADKEISVLRDKLENLNIENTKLSRELNTASAANDPLCTRIEWKIDRIKEKLEATPKVLPPTLPHPHPPIPLLGSIDLEWRVLSSRGSWNATGVLPLWT